VVCKMGALKMQDWKIMDLSLPNLKFDGLAMPVSIARFC